MLKRVGKYITQSIISHVKHSSKSAPTSSQTCRGNSVPGVIDPSCHDLLSPSICSVVKSGQSLWTCDGAGRVQCQRTCDACPTIKIKTTVKIAPKLTTTTTTTTTTSSSTTAGSTSTSPFTSTTSTVATIAKVVIGKNEIACRNEKGEPVDWWYVYKLPDLNEHSSSLVQNGLGFLYMDGENPSWKLSTKSLRDAQQPIAYTLQQMYDKKGQTNEIYHGMYSDAHANGKDDSYRGHSKGVQLFDENTGFWLVHSIPRFPPIDKYSYPDSGTNNGQSMLCVTMKTKETLGEIAEQLYYTMPSMYSSNVPSSFAAAYPRLSEVIIDRKSYTAAAETRTTVLKSYGGKEFTHFAKNKKWDKDIYQDLVAPGLKQSLYVSTWLNGNGDLKSGCDGSLYKVWNLRKVDPAGIPFLNSKDHSKWAITDNANDPWVCIGDINRQQSQDDRAGGTLCSKYNVIWNQYYGALEEKEVCDGSTTAAGSDQNVCLTSCTKCKCQCLDNM